MFIEIISFLLLGIFAGTITGLIPGIHINLISAFLVTISTTFFLNPIYAITFITAMSITHTFTDFIPSIFLGCPDTDTELGILPGHRMLKDKRGFEAIHLSAIGSLIAIALTIIIFFPSIFLLKIGYSAIEKIIPFLLILISILLILSEEDKKNAIIVLLITGFLGLSINQINFNQPLLPLLSGLFGASNIILSIKNKIEIPEQIITKAKVKLKKPIISALASAPLCSFLPSFGSGQAALIGNLINKNSEEQFILLLGIINTLVMTFSFISFYTINKTRTGTTLAINNIIGQFTTNHIILILIIIVLSGIISFFLTIHLAKFFSQNLKKINYKTLSYATLLILIIITFIISGFIGLIILFISTITGIYCINLNVKRTNMMGCLIIPTIIWLL